MTIEQVQLAEHLMYNLLSIIRYDAYEVMLSLVTGRNEVGPR